MSAPDPSPADPWTNQVSEHRVVIQASPARVWTWLTDPGQMQRWMGEPEMGVEVETDWAVGRPIVVRGFHHLAFENRGTVLCFEPGVRLRYTHLSSLSQLADEPGSYSTIDFELAAVSGGTALRVSVRGFPTESIFRHLDFYWRGTMSVLKELAEAA
jgi:uncharacterized protein YndB with AHSA1/START domain